MQHYIVSAYLVKRALADYYVRSLVFDNHPWASLGVIQHSVAAFRGFVQRERHFVCQHFTWVSLVLDEETDEVLPHPFLGREADVASSNCVKHVCLAVAFRQPQWGRWQVQFLHNSCITQFKDTIKRAKMQI